MQLTLTEAQINVRRDGSVALLANEGEILFRGQCAKELQQAYAKQECAVISINFKDQTGIMSF